MSEFFGRGPVDKDVFIAKFDGTDEIEYLLDLKTRYYERKITTENIIRHGCNYSSNELIVFLGEVKLPNGFIE